MLDHADNNGDGYCDDCDKNVCGHASVKTVNAKAATCTEDGYTGDKVCEKCGVTLETGTTITKLGHNLGDWIVSVSATCTAKGEEIRTCSRCDYFETKELPMLDHADNDGDGKCDDCGEPTHTHEDKDGDGKCDDCGEPTHTHEDKDGDGKCDDCGNTLDAVRNCKHLCHKTGLLGFIWKIINIFNIIFRINKTCSCGMKHY